MLAERKRRVKWSLNPRGNVWSQDTSKFGQQMLEKMGWKPGCGLGANEQGITEHIKVSYKSDKKCIGYKEHGDEWLEQQSQFENLLAELGSSHDIAVSDKGNESLELRSQQSRARVHYHKFTRGKDLSNYSDKDLACILGVKKPDTPDYSSVKARKNDMDTLIGKVENLYGVTTVNGGNMNEYFIKKKHKNDDAAEENQAEFQCEKEVGIELEESVREAQIETKKKRKRKNPESSDIEGKDVHRQETEENKLALDGDNAYGSNCKKKKRKLEHETKGEQMLKEDERNYERHTEGYSEKDAYNFEDKGNIIKQELKRKQKKEQRESPDMDREEVEQETDGNEMNDNSANYLNYKIKKRKLDQKAKEYLLEEEIIKQYGRSVESYIEKDMYSFEGENNKIKRKKKQKEKCTESPDAYGKEVETCINDTTLLNDVHGLNCRKKKRKLKQEVKERIEDEIIEPGETAKDDFDSSDPTRCYRSKKKREKNSLQKNGEYVDCQNSVTATDMTMQEKDSFRKLKNGKRSVYSDSEKGHCETKDNEIMEEETRKHKIKKKKKHKDKDETLLDIQEHRLVQHKLEETEAESCDKKNCEEPSVIDETSVFANYVRKEKRRKRRILNQTCTSVDLECENFERIQEQNNTETNQQKSETATQSDGTQNVEGSKADRNNSKCEEELCNSDLQNCAGAADFEKTGVNRRNMRPSVFAQLVDPSLIKFRGSNLCKIPGYGCYKI